MTIPERINGLNSTGLKATLPRLKIMEILQRGEQHHVSADDVYRALLDAGSDIGLATVYRVLMQFEQAGLVSRCHFESNKTLFELNRGPHHDHLICVRCGRVEEFHDPQIEQRQRQIAQERGFDLTEHTLALYGVCARTECRTRNAPGRATEET